MMRLIKNLIHVIQSFLANIRYGFPAKGMTILGVTGTDGKTTSVSMIYHILQQNGIKAGMISTIEVKIGDRSYDSGLHVTTPDPWKVPKYMRLMKDAGCKYVVIEATSNGLDQNRLAGIKFDSVMITNIRNDHLDYHKTWENYARAKFRLIRQLKAKGVAVLNSDDKKSANWLANKSEGMKKFVYARWVTQDELKNKNMSVDGITFNYKDIHFKVPILGEHNFENVFQVIAMMEKYLDLVRIQTVLASFKAPMGRMQIMQSRPFTVIVDFAHTPNALTRALESVTQIEKDKNSRIITVFGCAGKRDKGRREMGAVSAKFADITVLTAEDPRDEDLALVNNEILKFAEKENGELIERFPTRKMYTGLNLRKTKEKIENLLASGKKPVFAFDENRPRSREDAIDFALKIAKKGDIVFITGKGHEKSLAFGESETEYPWSDQKVVKEKLARMSKEL